MVTATLEKSSFELTQRNQPLHDSVRQSLENYISHLKGELPSNLYELILGEVEAPLNGSCDGIYERQSIPCGNCTRLKPRYIEKETQNVWFA